jgi:hypothetical protein
MKKRSLFVELKTGLDELPAERRGEMTLRTVATEVVAPVESNPNARAALLIRLVEKYPETLEHLAAL